MHCTNRNLPEYKILADQSGLSDSGLASKVSVWQDKHGLDKIPTMSELFNTTDEEKTKVTNYLLSQLKEVQPNFRIEVIKDLNDFALVNFEKQVIQIQDKADFNNLNEEIVHILIELLPDDLKNQLDTIILDTSTYREVFESYKNDPEYKIGDVPNIPKIKREAVGQYLTSYFNNTPLEKITNKGIINKILSLISKLKDFLIGNLDPVKKALELINSGQLYNTLPDTGIYKSKITFTEKGHLLQLYGSMIGQSGNSIIDLDDPSQEHVYINNAALLGTSLYDFIGYLGVCLKLNNFSKLTKVTITDVSLQDFKNKILVNLFDKNGNITNVGQSLKDALNLKDFFTIDEVEHLINTLDITPLHIQDIKSNYATNNSVYVSDRTPLPLNTDMSSVKTRFTENSSKTGVINSINYLTTFFENQKTPTQKNKLESLLKYLKNRVYYDKQILDEMNGVDSFNMEHTSKFRNAINNMKNITDLVEGVNNLVFYLQQLEHLTFTLKNYHLNQNYINHQSNPLYGTNKISNLLKLKNFSEPWLNIISELRSYNNNDQNEIAILLNNISGNLTDINRLASMFTKEEISTHINNRLKVFNNSIDEEYAPVLKKLEDAGLLDELNKIKEEIQQQKYRVEEDIKGDTFVDKLLSGEMGDLVGGSPKGNTLLSKATSQISNTITTVADQSFVSLSQSHDPVLAVLGEYMDSVTNKAVDDFNRALLNREKAEPLIEQIGGSVIAGERLIVNEERLVRKKLHNFNKNIDYFVTETQNIATFANQYGTVDNYNVIIDNVPVTLSNKTLDVLKAVYKDHGYELPDVSSLRYRELLDFYDTLLEYSAQNELEVEKEQLDATILDLKSIKDSFEAEWLRSNYVTSLQDLLSFRYLSSKEDKELLEKTLNNYYDLLGEKTKQNNILKYTSSNVESELQAKNTIVELNLKIEALKDVSTKEGKLLVDFLTQRELFRENKNNINALLRKIEQIFSLPNQREYIKTKLDEILSIPSDNEDAILKKIIELHIKTSDPSYHSYEEVSKEDIQNLNDILDEMIYYHETEDFYYDRTVIVNKLATVEMSLNPGNFYMIIGESMVQGLLKMQLNSEDFAIYDTMMDDEGKLLLPVYTDLELGKKEQGDNNFIFTFTFPDARRQPAYVLVENKKLKNFNESNASAAFEEIATISKKYRTKNLNQTDFSIEDQKRVTELSQIIEDSINRNSKTLNTVNENALKQERKNLYKELSEISNTYYRESYYANFKMVLNDYNALSNPLLIKLRDSSKYFSKFRITIKDLLSDKDEEFLNLVKNPDTSNLNQHDLAVLNWVTNNHYFRTIEKKKKDETQIYEVVEPARNYKKTVPSLNYFDSYFKYNLGNNYVDSKYKDEFLDKNSKDTKNRFLPKKIQSSAVTDRYHSLSETEKEIHRLLVENIHIAEQKKKSNFVANTSYLWYDAPTLYKKAAELSLSNRIKKLYDNIRGLVNPLEQGFFGKDVLENPQENTNLKTSVLKYIESLKNRTPGNIEQLAKEDKHDTYFHKKIPVDYTENMKAENVSRDISSSIVDYTFSLNKAFHYSENISFVSGTIDNISDTKGKGSSKRKVRLEKYLEQIVFRRQIGKNNFLAMVFRFVKKTLVLGSQTVFNPVGGTKNIIQSLLVNYMFAPPNTKYGWNLKPTDTVKSVEWLKKIALDRTKLNGKESLESFLVRRVNANNANISELLSNNIHSKEFFLSGEFIYALQNGGERMVTYQLMLSTFNSLYFTLEKNNPETQINFLDIWEETNTGWKMKPVYDKNGNLVDESIFLDIKRYINNFRFNTTGHGEKGVFLNSEIGKNLFFFMNFIIPVILNGFTSNRRNFIENRVTENLHVSFVKNLLGMLTSLGSEVKRWDLMTIGQKKDFIKGAVLYSSMAVIYFVIRGLFGYNPEDEDKMAELDEMNDMEGFLLLTAVKVMTELESQSFVSFTSNYPMPIITQNKSLISKPMVIDRLSKILETAFDGITLQRYKSNNKAQNIHKGDLKFLRELHSFVPYNITSDYNPDLDFIQALKNLEGAKNMR